MLSPYSGISPHARPHFVPGGGSPFAFLTSSTISAHGNTTMDGTGASLALVALAHYDGGIANFNLAFNDSLGNFWTRVASVSASDPSARLDIAYCTNPVVGVGQQFNVVAGGFCTTCVSLFSGSLLALLDQQSFAAGVSPGSITPSANNSVVIAGLGCDTGSYSIPAGYTSICALAVGANEGLFCGYKIQTSASTENVSFTGSGTCASGIVSFKP